MPIDFCYQLLRFVVSGELFWIEFFSAPPSEWRCASCQLWRKGRNDISDTFGETEKIYKIVSVKFQSFHMGGEVEEKQPFRKII